MIREGFRDEVLNSLTIWLCASCYSCTVQCPRQIQITDVMYALKREAIAPGVYPKRFPIPVLAREFFSGVRADGRNTEGPLLVRFFLKTESVEDAEGCHARPSGFWPRAGCRSRREDAHKGIVQQLLLRCRRAPEENGT